MSDTGEAATHIIEAYKSAVFARDATALMRLYAPKVRVFDAWGVWSYDNAQSWQRAVESWFNSLGSEQVQVTFEDVIITGAGGSAIVSAIVTYAGISAEGSTLRSMQNRLTWALGNSEHGLRIVHEHTSAPIGFEDQKAILKRPT